MGQRRTCEAKKRIGVPGSEFPLHCERNFQAGQRRTWAAREWRRRELVCLSMDERGGNKALREAFPGGPTHLPDHTERGLVCLDVSQHRGIDAFPGGPTHLPMTSCRP